MCRLTLQWSTDGYPWRLQQLALVLCRLYLMCCFAAQLNQFITFTGRIQRTVMMFPIVNNAAARNNWGTCTRGYTRR